VVFLRCIASFAGGISNFVYSPTVTGSSSLFDGNIVFDRQTLTSLSSNSTTANPARAAPAASPEATQVCFDFAKGRCARPACRFLHEGGVSERAPLGLAQVCESPPVSSLCMPAPKPVSGQPKQVALPGTSATAVVSSVSSAVPATHSANQEQPPTARKPETKAKVGYGGELF